MAWPRASAATVGLLNLVIAVLQVLAGVNGFLSIPDLVTLQLAPIFISAYAILFALPLFLYECKFKRFHRILRRQMGFIFHFYGRCAYLVFIAFMDVGIPGGLGMIIAVLIGVNLVFMLSLRCCGVPLDETRPLIAGQPHDTYNATVMSPQNVVKVAKFLS
ncbi:hypothetical protein H257_18276 [Aphanomyces astaci]|uniref:COPI associated protein n=1 Tax=Aphanomyces astaci TaxID=112090 RepID=W4FBP4_APHAT|nr:hypothetical protein H257_18276 [Aphanomyces astaci]ETV64910.1 hypothetical protein H257_18276 [Aphanomyces astaci]RQM27289.1 hypothetical protein B5M09_007906 [Aphanomyces astaci]|eukprot:XP_009845607.1 hypothetical protein H257_18276 [Aphanomyces astaci]